MKPTESHTLTSSSNIGADEYLFHPFPESFDDGSSLIDRQIARQECDTVTSSMHLLCQPAGTFPRLQEDEHYNSRFVQVCKFRTSK